MSWRCRLRGHRWRFGDFDRAVLAHDLVCKRCGEVQTAPQLLDAIKAARGAGR